MITRKLTLKKLLENFEKGVGKFYAEKEASFSNFYKGPRLHFHVRTIKKIRSLLQTRKSSYRDICNDTEYVELLYATLTAWGIDGIGRGQKLQDFDKFKGNLQNSHFIKCLDSLKGSTLAKLNEISTIKDHVKQAYDWLNRKGCILRTNKAPVGAAKALHHLLPDLLMPVDKKYVISLLNRLEEKEFRPSKQGGSFRDYWKCICVSHLLCKEKGLSHVGPTRKYPMSTSIPKLIDNSLIGMSVIFESDNSA